MGRWTSSFWEWKNTSFFLSISFYVDSINKLNRKPYLQRPFVRESKIPLNQCVWCFEKFIRFNAAVGSVDNTLLISFLCNFISLVTKAIRRTLVKLLSSAKLYGMMLFFFFLVLGNCISFWNRMKLRTIDNNTSFFPIHQHDTLLWTIGIA